MKRLGYEIKKDKYLSVRVPGQRLYHRLDKMDEMFQKDAMRYAFGNGEYPYYRHYYTGAIRYVKRANLTPLQKKYYAKMYRLGVIEKRGFRYRSAELAAEIKKMKQLQEQYLFLCQNDIASVVDLIEINLQNKQRIGMIADRQHDIYVERANRKRKCKSVENLHEYQLWHMESQQELDQLKAEKKELKQQIRMGESCLKENLATAKYVVSEREELLYEAKDEIPDFEDLRKVCDKQAEIVEMDLFKKELNEPEGIKTSEVAIVDEEVEIKELSIQERVERIVNSIAESDKGYEELSYRKKAEVFEFKLDDVADNMKLHEEVLTGLGIRYSGAEVFEDYQGIYDEAVKREERAGGSEESIVSERREKEGRNR